jgi:uncharacterized protein YecT (DUF1311 family)
MKKAGAIIALIAGVFGVIAAFVTLAFGGVASAFGTKGGSTVVALGWGGVLFSLLVIVFGAIAFAKPKFAGWALVVCSIAGAVLGGTLVAVAMVLSLVGGILAVVGAKNDRTVRADVTSSVASAPSSPLSTAAPARTRKPWVFAAIGAAALILIILIAAGLSPSGKSVPDPLSALATTPPSELRPDGELAELFTLGSSNTNLQRENKAKEITGQVVEWRLPVYEVSHSGDEYKIQTREVIRSGPSQAKLVGAFVYVRARTDEERRTIEALKTNDPVSFKGRIEGVFLRSLQIRPAVLSMSAPQPSPARNDAPPAAIPNIPAIQTDESYASVRQKMLQAGWTPFHADTADVCAPDDNRCKDRPEMLACAGTGLANCKFLWQKDGKTIAISTVGESDPTYAGVSSQPGAPARTKSQDEEPSAEKSGICKGLDLAVTAEQSECLDRKFKAADDALNRNYRELLAKLNDAEKSTLRESQRAWVLEKRQKCAKAGEEFQGGTMEAVAVADCNVQMTEQRVAFLADYKP